jgi:hypothetical protein
MNFFYRKKNKVFLVIFLILLLAVIFVIAADLTPGIEIQPNTTEIKLSAYNSNMSFDKKNFTFESIEVDTNEVRFANDSTSSSLIFNSTFSFNKLNITLIEWDLANRNVTTLVSGATSPNFLYFNISRNDSSPCYLNQTNVANGYLNDYCVARLEPVLVTPDTSATTDIIQNTTFIVNATVYCRDSDCGNIYGTVMYNLSSSYPNTPVNTTKGDKPFYVNESPALAMKACPTNPLLKDQFCNISWIVNATGTIGTDWKIGVFFNSSYADVNPNSTLNATVSIVSSTVDFNITWSSIRLGLLNPSTSQQPAQGNMGNLYNITVNPGSCNIDFYIKGTYLENKTLNSRINVENITWSNTSNTYSSSFNLLSTNSVIKLNVPQKANITTWYWINVPAVYAGYYNGTINITGVRNGQTP